MKGRVNTQHEGQEARGKPAPSHGKQQADSPMYLQEAAGSHAEEGGKRRGEEEIRSWPAVGTRRALMWQAAGGVGSPVGFHSLVLGGQEGLGSFTDCVLDFGGLGDDLLRETELQILRLSAMTKCSLSGRLTLATSSYLQEGRVMTRWKPAMPSIPFPDSSRGRRHPPRHRAAPPPAGTRGHWLP